MLLKMSALVKILTRDWPGPQRMDLDQNLPNVGDREIGVGTDVE